MPIVRYVVVVKDSNPPLYYKPAGYSRPPRFLPNDALIYRKRGSAQRTVDYCRAGVLDNFGAMGRHANGGTFTPVECEVKEVQF